MFSVFLLTAGLLFQSYDCGACVVIKDGDCNEPRVLERMSMHNYSSAIYSQTYSLYPGWSHTEKSLSDIPAEFRDIQKEHFSGNFKCAVHGHGKRTRSERKAIFHQVKHNMNQLALCPWEFVKNIDGNRKPEILMEAVCACKFPNSEHPGLFCENVYQHVTVFRRSGCDGGEYSYEKVSERISVACVTIAPPTEKNILKEDKHSRMGEK